MLNAEKKGGVAILIGARPGGEAKDEAAPDDGEETDTVGAGETAAARSIIKAIEGGNPDNLRSALKNFGVACGWGDDAPEPDSDDGKTY
jgi:hypothetical protein